MFVVETLPLALAIGCNHSGQPNLKMVNICLIPSKKTLILPCPMFYVPCPVCFLPMSFGPIYFVCPMSCATPRPMHSTSHVLCAFFPCPLVPYVLCVPCPVSHHVLCTLRPHVQCAKYQQYQYVKPHVTRWGYCSFKACLC